MIIVTKASTKQDLQGILDLQQANLPTNISKEEAFEQGFVTVIHDLSILTKMNDAAPHTIAKDGEKVVGYCLSMLQKFRYDVPAIKEMFDMADDLLWQEKPLSTVPYFAMGQTCVAKSYRGIGVFDQLYNELRANFASEYELVITEISKRNQRSARAHERVGFETLLEYQDTSGETWWLVAWDLRK